jgi:hypothetical protein
MQHILIAVFFAARNTISSLTSCRTTSRPIPTSKQHTIPHPMKPKSTARLFLAAAFSSPSTIQNHQSAIINHPVRPCHHFEDLQSAEKHPIFIEITHATQSEIPRLTSDISTLPAVTDRRYNASLPQNPEAGPATHHALDAPRRCRAGA